MFAGSLNVLEIELLIMALLSSRRVKRLFKYLDVFYYGAQVWCRGKLKARGQDRPLYGRINTQVRAANRNM